MIIQTLRPWKQVTPKENNHKECAKWYDKDCKDQQSIFFEARKTYLDNNKNEEDRVLMCKQRTKYRKLCRNKKKEYEPHRGRASC